MELIFIFILGLSIGSFLNVLIDRLPAQKSIFGRSHCDHCKRQLEWIDLIPVLSYLALRGKCRRCRKKISLYYPLVEIITGVGFVFVLRNLNDLSYLSILSYLVIACSLVVIFFADLKYRIIPDEATAGFTLLSFLLIYLTGKNLTLHLLSGLGLSLGLYIIYLLTRSRGMGLGDVKLAFPVGLLQGPTLGIIAIYLAFITGGIFALLLLTAKKKGLKSKIAFGPFIVIGLVLTIIFKEQVMILFNHFFS